MSLMIFATTTIVISRCHTLFLSMCYCFSVFIWFVSFVFICSPSIAKWRDCILFRLFCFFFILLDRIECSFGLYKIIYISRIEVFCPWNDMICFVAFFERFFCCCYCVCVWSFCHWFEIRSSDSDLPVQVCWAIYLTSLSVTTQNWSNVTNVK